MMTKLILATGTNGARASTGRHIDFYQNITYFDMLIAKVNSTFEPRRTLPFKMNRNMNRIPNVEFYQLHFPELLEGGFDTDNLPSWTKIVENPSKAKGIIHKLFSMLFNGDSGQYEYMALENVFGGHKPTGIMIWLSEGGRKENIDQFAAILQPIIPDWKVVALHGDETNNREAENHVKKMHAQAIMEGKNGVVVVSMKIGARSFSVPEIDTVLLAYDNGSAAQTAQKMSRCLTPGVDSKVGRVVSLSLDPSREDKLDAPILETAQKVAEKENIDITEALKMVLRTLNVFVMDHQFGERVHIDIDDYTKKILSMDSLSKVIAKTIDMNTIINNPDMVARILSITAQSMNLGKAEVVAAKGKKFIDKGGKVNPKAKTENDDERDILSLMLKIQQAIEALVVNMPFIAYLAPEQRTAKTILLATSLGENNAIFIDEFGVEPKFVYDLIDMGIISNTLVDLTIGVQRREDGKNQDAMWA